MNISIVWLFFWGIRGNSFYKVLQCISACTFDIVNNLSEVVIKRLKIRSMLSQTGPEIELYHYRWNSVVAPCCALLVLHPSDAVQRGRQSAFRWNLFELNNIHVTEWRHNPIKAVPLHSLQWRTNFSESNFIESSGMETIKSKTFFENFSSVKIDFIRLTSASESLTKAEIERIKGSTSGSMSSSFDRSRLKF